MTWAKWGSQSGSLWDFSVLLVALLTLQTLKGTVHRDCHIKQRIFSSCFLEIFKLLNSLCQYSLGVRGILAWFTLASTLVHLLDEKWLHGEARVSRLAIPSSPQDQVKGSGELEGTLRPELKPGLCSSFWHFLACSQLGAHAERESPWELLEWERKGWAQFPFIEGLPVLSVGGSTWYTSSHLSLAALLAGGISVCVW